MDLPLKEPDDIITKTAKILGYSESLVREVVMYQYKYAFDFFSSPTRPGIRLPELGTFRMSKHGLYKKLKYYIQRARSGRASDNDIKNIKLLFSIRHLPRVYDSYLKQMRSSVKAAMKPYEYNYTEDTISDNPS